MNFNLNMALSGLLAVVLFSGVILALMSASRAMKLSEMKADFVSNVSHELRTPLASIRVFGELLRQGMVADPAKVREYGEYIDTESRRLSQLINNILDFAKIDSGRKTYRFKLRDVREVVEGVIRSFEVSASQHGIKLRFEAPSEPTPPVRIDADAFSLAVHNLVDNAVKYSNGQQEVEVRVGVEEGGVSVSVRDQGMGISRAEQAKIFERFHRVGTGLVHEVRGSGLGLSIVKHVMDAHGGRVTVESEQGKGSCFSLHLPIAGRPSPGESTDSEELRESSITTEGS